MRELLEMTRTTKWRTASSWSHEARGSTDEESHHCGERCESQSESDSLLSVKSDGNDMVSNGETDEETEDGRGGIG